MRSNRKAWKWGSFLMGLMRTLLAGVVLPIRDPGQQKGRVEANGTMEWLIR
jgi:hypothetical protein